MLQRDEGVPEVLGSHCLTPTRGMGMWGWGRGCPPRDVVVVLVPTSHPRQLRKRPVARQSPA